MTIITARKAINFRFTVSHASLLSEQIINNCRLKLNDRDKDCYNGDIGRLFVHSEADEASRYSVLLSDGRFPTWVTDDGLRHLTLAYAVTVHKSQGSEYDTVLLPISKQMQSMMMRNLLYTAISRARKQVVLFGELEALDTAMQCAPRKRRSMLIQKTRMALQAAA